MSLGDIIEWFCILIALWYVPRHFLRVYAPGVSTWFRSWWHVGVQRAQGVKSYAENTTHVMSRCEESAPASPPSSLETDGRELRQTDNMPRVRAEELLTLYKVMRAAGIERDKAQAAFKASGLPFNNNVWASAAPIETAEPAYVTPIVGRPTSAKFETDPDFPFEPCRS